MSQIQQSLRKSVFKADVVQEILQHRIGFGSAQNRLARPLNFLLFSEGSQSIVLGLLLPELGKQWNMGVYEKSLLITAVYVGVVIGSYVQTYADIYGRYTFITYNAVLQTIFGLLSCVSFSFQSFLVCRFFYGLGIGIVLPLSGTYFVQICPSKDRAAFLSSSRVYWSLGCLVSTLAGWLLLANNHWRVLLFIVCLPGIYALVDHKMNGRQSLRYLWAKKDLKGVSQLLDYMAQKNSVDKIPIKQIQQLMRSPNQNQQQILCKQQNNSSVKDLFNQKYRFITSYLIFGWFSVCFVYYGILLLLPSILQGNQSLSLNYRYFVVACLSVVQIITFWLVQFVMNHQKIGRKKSIYGGFAIVTLCSVFLLFSDQQSEFLMLILFVLIKIFITGTFMTLYPYTSEMYQTLYRGKAMGVTSCIGRIGTAFLGMIGVSALEWFDGDGLYVMFIFFCSVASFLVYKIPYDTLNRPIDT